MNKLLIIPRRYLSKIPTRERGTVLERYGITFILLFLFFLLDFIFSAVFGEGLRFILALFVVILCAWFAGFGPGIFATMSSGVVTYIILLSVNVPLSKEEYIVNVISLVIFFISGLLINFLIESHRISDQQRSEFLGMVSHEIKNPLTPIKGYAQLISRLAQRNKIDGRISQYAERIDKQVVYITALINEMLDMSKLEAGKLTYHDKKFEIKDLVKEVVDDQQVTTTTHRIELKSKTNKVVNGDRYRIGQVIMNLLMNSVKYSPNAKKVIVKLESKRSGVMIAVQDFGVGIRKQDQDKIFQPFYRSKTSPTTKGTGVGLYISSEIVKRHGGKLWFDSKEGKGSTFYFFLPAKPVTKITDNSS